MPPQISLLGNPLEVTSLKTPLEMSDLGIPSECLLNFLLQEFLREFLQGKSTIIRPEISMESLSEVPQKILQ